MSRLYFQVSLASLFLLPLLPGIVGALGIYFAMDGEPGAWLAALVAFVVISLVVYLVLRLLFDIVAPFAVGYVWVTFAAGIAYRLAMGWSAGRPLFLLQRMVGVIQEGGEVADVVRTFQSYGGMSDPLDIWVTLVAIGFGVYYVVSQIASRRFTAWR